MNSKFKDFYYIFGANFVNLVLGFVSGFILPAFLDYSNYGYIKLFAFYLGYVGVMHLGFLDGIFIKFGAYNYEELPKEKFRTYLRFLFIMQVIEAIIISVIIINIGSFNERIIVNIFVVINMVIMNVTSFFTFVHQITKRFKLFSINTILSKVIYVLGVVVLLCFKEMNFIYYIILQTITNLVILGIYIANNKSIVFGRAESFKKNYTGIKQLMKSGFVVMSGSFIALIVLGIDRIFVDSFLTQYDFVMYSFAYTLVSLFYLILNSLTTVVYPYLARANSDNLNIIYKNARFAVSITMSITLAGYFILKFIVQAFIARYTDALPVLTFLVPTVIYSAVINILVINTYKVMALTKEYFLNNLISLIVSVLTNIIAIIIFKNNSSIAIATLISFIVWTVYSDSVFSRKFNIKVSKIYMFDFIILAVFIYCAYTLPWIIGLIVYIVAYLLITVLGFKQECINIFKSIIKK